MTVLAALWPRDERPGQDLCRAMIRAQWPASTAPIVQQIDRVALGIGSIAHTGDAPLSRLVIGAAGRLALAADVRLDNRTELMRQLGLTLADAGALSDAQLMMLAFERWGQDAVVRFVGDFALVLWDRAAGLVHLARDFAGQRPLFFHRSRHALAIASMAKGLHVLDFVPCRPNRMRLLESMAGLPHEGAASFFEDIERVEPGQIVSFGPDRRSARSYWAPPTDIIRLPTHRDYAEALIQKLGAAVDARLRGAGAAVGTHLSAGLDSSAVTALAAGRSASCIHAFTSVPSGDLPELPDGRFGDEGGLAALTAGLYPNVLHQRVQTGERIPLEDLDWQIALFERPDLNLPNLAWSNRINDAAKAEGVTVMLTGGAGNATLSYGDFHLLYEILGRGMIGTFVSGCIAARRTDILARAPVALLARRILPSRAFQALRAARDQGSRPAAVPALNPAAPGASEVLTRWARLAQTGLGNSNQVRWDMLRRVDSASYTKGVLLRWNLDLRDPTADRDLVEFCMRIPIGQFFHKGVSRALARTALKGLVPDAVRLDRRRGLQSANWFAMLTNAQAEAGRILDQLADSAEVRVLLDMDALQRLYQDWPAPSASFGPLEYRTSLLRGLMVGAFIRSCAPDHDARARNAPTTLGKPQL